MAKKPRKVVRASKEHIDYMSIGHTAPDNKVWVYTDAQIFWWPSEKGTHAEILGKKAESLWRGRLETYTNRCTVIPPNSTAYANIPSWLKDKLEHEFGTGLQFVSFNPKR